MPKRGLNLSEVLLQILFQEATILNKAYLVSLLENGASLEDAVASWYCKTKVENCPYTKFMNKDLFSPIFFGLFTEFGIDYREIIIVLNWSITDRFWKSLPQLWIPARLVKETDGISILDKLFSSFEREFSFKIKKIQEDLHKRNVAEKDIFKNFV